MKVGYVHRMDTVRDTFAPIYIRAMLHYYAFVDDYEASPDLYSVLLGKDLIEPTGNEGPGAVIYRITERGEAYVKGLCSVQLPEKHWIIPA